MISNERILVTGGAGFIGSHVAERLAETNTVTVLDNFSVGRDDHLDFLPADRVIDGDVRDVETVRDAVAGQDVVVHMAAMMGVQRTLENPFGVLEVNIDGTRVVLEQAAQVGVDRVLFASTSEVYGDVPDVPYHEDDPKAPETNYAVAKQASERFARAYSSKHDLDHTIIRYFNVYGPRQDCSPYGYVIPIFVNRALSGEPIEVHGDGRQTRDFTYISDAVDCTVAALSSAGRNRTYNIGTGRETEIRQLAETVADVLPNVDITHVNHPRPYVIEQRCADISWAESKLGYDPATSIEDGITQLAEYLKNMRTDSSPIKNQ